MVKVAVIGGTGYTGVELLRILAGHPGVEVSMITSRSEAGKSVADAYPNLRGHYRQSFCEPDMDALSSCDLVFFATPNGTAMEMARELLAAGARIIDLAADFRIADVAVWEHWYGMRHACPELLADAVYGLPELNREKIRTASLVANPGCYPTAVTLALLPLLAEGLVDTQRLIADGKSGVSGAGRKGQVAMLMGETGESFKAYSVPGHRHLPEMRQVLGSVAGGQIGLTFVPHLVPMIRGIEASVYATLNGQPEDLQRLYQDYYRDEPFVDVMPQGSHPETRFVRGSNHCRLALHRPQGGDVLVLLSVIDNLVKGAAGQAVQNMNLMFGLDERAGLDTVPLMP
jgi:N-acetyl-gamma-glutamyl-phosphate reductase